MRTRADIMAWRRAERVRLQEARRALGRAEREASTARIAELLQRNFPELAGAAVGFYWPFKGELDLRGLARTLHEAGSRLSLPVVVQKAAPLEFWHWEPRTRLARGDWGIPVPAERIVEHPTALIVPLLGFDEAGYRLGYGGGYYDRTLAAMEPRPFTVGAGFELGRLKTIFPLEHDIPLDAIATEAGFVRHDRIDGRRRPAD
ncbi:MAG TPA: 5-formyltetrahydrofolate cyclo-ligase [Woeseiaceae bacterium]|nr:5-formyltetrahydrofolate cyclo-ligase [Woeseiaceae bacterium]